MSNWTNDAILDALRGVVEPDLGKDVVSLDLVEVEGTAGDHGAGLTLTVKSSNPAMHARKRMQEAVEFALERAFGKPVSCDVKVIPPQFVHAHIEREIDLWLGTHWSICKAHGTVQVELVDMQFA